MVEENLNNSKKFGILAHYKWGEQNVLHYGRLFMMGGSLMNGPKSESLHKAESLKLDF